MRLVTTLLLLTVLALPAGASSKRKRCVQACGSLIAACDARNQDLGDFRRACTTAVLRECRKAGPALCTTTTTSSSTTTTLRFVDKGDGTVTDHWTGLQWEQKANLDGSPNAADPHDADNTYTWCVGPSAVTCMNPSDPPDGTAFTSFLASLNSCASSNGSTVTGGFAGHCDWRLPSIVELEGIVDLNAPGCSNRTSPCIDQTVFGPTSEGDYWSATTSAITAPTFPGAWDVNFFDGTVFNYPKFNGDYVRAVRTGS
jgi:hypothetical protein